MSTTKTPQAMYEELVAAIVKAVPTSFSVVAVCMCGKDLPHNNSPVTEFCGMKGDMRMDIHPITLEDVLFAYPQIEENYNANCQCGCDNKDWRTLEIVNRWSLNKPLSEQSPETISFLHSLLCV